VKANQGGALIISHDTAAEVQTALDLLRKGLGLTAGESGTVAYDPIVNLDLIGEPRVMWDGLNYTVFLFVSAG